MVLVLLLLSGVTGVLTVPTQPLDLVHSGWTDDYDAAVEAAREAGLPLLIVLEDDCKASIPLFSLNSPELLKVLSRYRLCRLDARSDVGQRIASGYNATQFPYALITDARCESIVFRGAGNFSQGSWRKTLANYAGPDPKVDGTAGTSRKPRSETVTETGHEAGDDEFDAEQKAFVLADLDEAQDAAERLRRPLLAYITMDKCHFCERMKRQTLKDEDVQAAVARSFASVILHRDQDGAWIDQFDVRIYPTTLLIGHDGRVVDRMEGFVSPQEFLGRLRQNQIPTISSVW